MTIYSGCSLSKSPKLVTERGRKPPLPYWIIRMESDPGRPRPKSPPNAWVILAQADSFFLGKHLCQSHVTFSISRSWLLSLLQICYSGLSSLPSFPFCLELSSRPFQIDGTKLSLTKRHKTSFQRDGKITIKQKLSGKPPSLLT